MPQKSYLLLYGFMEVPSFSAPKANLTLPRSLSRMAKDPFMPKAETSSFWRVIIDLAPSDGWQARIWKNNPVQRQMLGC